MGKIDVAIKHTIAAHPRDWAEFLGVGREVPLEVVDSDVSALAAVTDKVFIVRTDPPFVLHIEPQAYYDEALDERMHAYAALLRRRHRLLVHTVVVALDRGALGAANRGGLKGRSPLGRCRLDFRYELVRVWRLPAEQILGAGPGVLPLAPIAKVPKPRTPEVVEQMARRLGREVPRAEEADLWTATYVLAGLRYDQAFARALLRGVREIMKESSTYQEIVAEGIEKGIEKGLVRGREQGRAEARQDVLILQGSRRFGQEPDEATLAAIRRITDSEWLEALLLRVLDADGWDDLLGSQRL